MFGRLGPAELILVLLVVVLLFGVGKLPQVGGAIGRGIREFRKAQMEDPDEEDSDKPKKKRKTSSKN